MDYRTLPHTCLAGCLMLVPMLGNPQTSTYTPPLGQRTLSFVNGVGGYAGAFDIGIAQTQPASNSKSPYVWIDNNGPDDDNQALLDFRGIFGPEPDRVPPGATVSRAVLRIYLGTNSNSFSYKPVSFHQMLVPWDGATTWGSAGLGGNGAQIDDIEARSDYDDIHIFGTQDYTYELDVTKSVQAWAGGAPQYGWLIRTGWSDGYAYYTTHNTLIDRRPELLVTFDADPDNRAPELGLDDFPPDGSTGVHEPAVILVTAGDPDADALDVVLYGRAAAPPSDPDFTVVLLPDTQNYAAEINGAVKEIFNSQTDWIVANREALNIPFVLHMGDIVQSGDIKGSTDNGAEWRNAAQAMYRLHRPDTTGLAEGIPFAVNVGNHDQEPIWRSSGTTTYFNQYFGVSHFERYSYFGGHYGDNNDNHYYLFKAGSYDFIVISLEYSDPARDPLDPDLLEWADALLKEYPGHRGIVISHHMINPGDPGIWSPYGEAMYEVLKDNPNLHLMLGGHVTGEGLLVSEYAGKTVYALVQDYQGLPEGGAGFLRLLTFRPRRNEIHLSTYSPWLDAAYADFGGEFSLPYDLGTQISPFIELARRQDVMSGSLLEFEWHGLEPATAYEWYVEASDRGKATASAVASFRSAARTYSAWRRGYFAEDDANGDSTADPDKDGYDNLAEFLFDGNPMVNGQIRIGLSSVTLDQGATELQYRRLTDFGYTWTYEVSSDLAQWISADLSPVQFDEQVTGNGDGTESVRLVIENPAGQPLYWRVRAAR